MPCPVVGIKPPVLQIHFSSNWMRRIILVLTTPCHLSFRARTSMARPQRSISRASDTPSMPPWAQASDAT